jgi:outer membrane lipoprotein-sorting protein
MNPIGRKIIVWTLVVIGGVLVGALVLHLLGSAQRREPPQVPAKDEPSDVTSRAEPNDAAAQAEPTEVTPQGEPNEATSKVESIEDAFEDEPEAHALYEKMIETMRNAQTLSYKGNCGNCTYTIWMKKPNYFRVETINRQGIECGTLVGDGENLWIYWPGDRPQFSSEDPDTYEKTRSNVYMTKVTPVGRHSIGHEVVLLGAGMGMTIIDPSTFHGYTDSLEPYLDGVRSWPAEKVQDQECDVIEVSFMKRQRIWYLWLSRKDHLPRKLKEVVRVANAMIGYEYWSDVSINADIPEEKFAWSPPEGWQQWTLPDPEDVLLKAGEEAPDFELLSADETRIKLSDHRGKVVWLYIWRAG